MLIHLHFCELWLCSLVLHMPQEQAILKEVHTGITKQIRYHNGIDI